jgi:hypothetical protein
MIIFISSIVSGLLYRIGGIGDPFKTWMRDWIIPLLLYGVLLFYWHPTNLIGWLMFVPSIALTGGALTTYWDELFGKDNFYFHGFCVGLGALPLIFSGIHWYMILVRAVFLCLGMGILNTVINKIKIPFSDWIEELSRGILILATVKSLLWFL